MTETDSLVGRSLGDRYRVDSLIARGGMARVYRAHDVRLDRDVALKVLSSPYADDPAFTRRFLEEARAAASLSHPSLVHVYDSGSDGGAHFIVMELLDRHRTLRDVLDTRGRLPAGEVLRIGHELLAGLRAVHDHDLVHCDVKAANVMLGPGPAKLIDFGIATAPHDGLVGDTSIGSLHYMSPEQLHGDALTPASDLFSLGAVLYEALTGRPPYPGNTPEAVSAAQRAEAVLPPSRLVGAVPQRLDEAILQSLRRDPSARFRTAQAMLVALDSSAAEVEAAEPGGRDEPDDETRVIETGYVPPAVPRSVRPPPQAPSRQGSSHTPPSPAGPPRPTSRRNPWPLVGTLVIFGAAALVVALVIVPLLQLGRGAAPDASATPAPAETALPNPEVVVVPQLVGRSTAEAIEAAGAAGLDWTVHCAHDESQPEGIVHQEPPEGTELSPGAPIDLYSARISDCQ